MRCVSLWAGAPRAGARPRNLTGGKGTSPGGLTRYPISASARSAARTSRTIIRANGGPSVDSARSPHPGSLFSISGARLSTATEERAGGLKRDGYSHHPAPTV
jgi:hypothetical protein